MDTVEPQWSETVSLIKTAVMDILEPQRPECGSLIEPTAADIVEHTLHPAGSAQKLDCYRNGYRRASEARIYSLRAPPRCVVICGEGVSVRA